LWSCHCEAAVIAGCRHCEAAKRLAEAIQATSQRPGLLRRKKRSSQSDISPRVYVLSFPHQAESLLHSPGSGAFLRRNPGLIMPPIHKALKVRGREGIQNGLFIFNPRFQRSVIWLALSTQGCGAKNAPTPWVMQQAFSLMRKINSWGDDDSLAMTAVS
jgi:hypothetical protein